MNEPRRWYQFSLTALFVLTFGVAILAGFVAKREAERERQRAEFESSRIEAVPLPFRVTPDEDR